MPHDIPFAIHFLDVGTGDAAIVDIGDRELITDGSNSPTVLRNYIRSRKTMDERRNTRIWLSK